MLRIRTAAHAGGIRQRERALQHMVLHDLPAVSAQELQKLRRRPLPAQREPGTAHQPEAQPCKPALPRMRKRRYDEQTARCEAALSLLAQAEKGCSSVSTLAVSGRDLLALGMTQGPAVGAVLKRLLDAVLDGSAPNDRASLLKLASEIGNNA